MEKKKVWLSWSSGKDSAWTLYQLQQDDSIQLEGVFTTINKEFERVAMHAVRVDLLKEQAKAFDLPLKIIELPFPCSNEQYELIMTDFLSEIKETGIDAFAFGDLYLEDIKDYRINNLKGTGIEAIFPLWKTPTNELSKEMVQSSLKTVITCVDPKQLDPSFVGREYNQSFLNDLPNTVDPCGENGEFHSFVYDGPMFKQKIDVNVGEVVTRDGFVFADIVKSKS
ncbi:MAG: adenine nucleotide alpha hydrolase [Candidatus Cloacimonetes bacterium]|nr:adenine nucleotide alpha hydrolase [Candidatus Cloacimonadota bacterium]